MSESHQSKIERFRKPRVHIKYEVETHGAQIKVDLPFVVGVMGDFSGLGGATNSDGSLKSLDERGFAQIDRNNFDEVLRKLNPKIKVEVDNVTGVGGDTLAEELSFESMDDFDPTKVAKQIPVLKKLLETRAKLRDYIGKVDKSKDLEALLEKVLQNQDELGKLSQELGIESDSPAGDSPSGGDAGSDEPEG